MVLWTGTQFVIPETGTLQGLEHSLHRPQIVLSKLQLMWLGFLLPSSI